MAGRLIERGGERAGRIHDLGPGVTTVGRGHDNDLVIAGEYISYHHAAVRREGTHYILEDRHSINGTLLNGRRITTAETLRPGDLIILPGRPGVTLVFDVLSGTSPLPAGHGRDDNRPCWLNAGTAEVRVRGEPVQLTAKEYRALALLYERGGALVGKDELAAHVWPEYAGAVADFNVEQLIARLRRKVDGDTGQARMLLTVRGLGYRLVLPD